MPFFDDWLARDDLDTEQREQLLLQRKDAEEYQRDVEAWRPHYERAIEYPASQIFVALRNGTLKAQGRLITGANPEQALDVLATSGRDIFDVAVTEIPSIFWTLQGIDLTPARLKTDLTTTAIFPSAQRMSLLISLVKERKFSGSNE